MAWGLHFWSSVAAISAQLRLGLERLVSRTIPGGVLVDVAPLAPDDADASRDETAKGAGYGAPLVLRAHDGDGRDVHLVFRTATANVFGHDYRADRAADMLLAYDTFDRIPNHIRPIDVGAVAGTELVSLAETGEFYLLTTYAPGALYADDLRRLARASAPLQSDRRRSRILATWLAALHRQPVAPPSLYLRSLRDVVGSGEGIFGIIDGYPLADDAALAARLRSIELGCVEWRWRLRDRVDRLRRIHGDFHPFNVLFDGDEIAVLDASRGSAGDPANDVACMAINYVFFALEREGAWAAVFRDLWYGFWRNYTTATGDDALYDVVAPYLVWRILVLANPAWYPAVAASHRDRLLDLADATLAAPRFSPELAEDVFA